MTCSHMFDGCDYDAFEMMKIKFCSLQGFVLATASMSPFSQFVATSSPLTTGNFNFIHRTKNTFLHLKNNYFIIMTIFILKSGGICGAAGTYVPLGNKCYRIGPISSFSDSICNSDENLLTSPLTHIDNHAIRSKHFL